jgi:hypothetical protein
MTLKDWMDAEKEKTKSLHPGKRRGTQEWLARRMKVNQGLVSRWLRRVTTPSWGNGMRIVRMSKRMVTMAELERVK